MDIRVSGSKDLEAFAADLKAASNRKMLRAKLRHHLTRAAVPIERAVKTAARGLPSSTTHKGRHRLRAAIARSVKRKVRIRADEVTVSVVLDGRSMPAGMGSLPAHMDSAAGWRHPVFGQDVWVRQPGHPFFDQAVRPLEGAAIKECENVIDWIARLIER